VTGLPLFAALVMIELIGLAALALIERTGVLWGWPERLALAWGLGCGAVSLGLFWALAFGLGLAVATALVAVIGLGAVVIVAWLKRPELKLRAEKAKPYGLRFVVGALAPSDALHGAEAPTTNPSWLTVILIALLLLNIAWVTLVGVARPLTDWDSWVTWGMKARAIFVDGGLVPGRYFNPSLSVTNFDYPLLIPLSEAWLYQRIGRADDQAAVFLFPPFYIALLVVFYSAVRRFASRNASLGFTLLVATTPRLERSASSAFADVPLAFFALVTFVFLLRWMETRRTGDLVVAGVFGGLIGWTKNEGLLLLALAGLALVAWTIPRLWRGTEPRWPLVLALLSFAGLSALAVAPWLAYRAVHHVGSYVFLPLTSALLQANADRLLIAAQAILIRMFAPTYITVWNFVWPLAVITVLLNWRRLRSPMAYGLWVIGGYLLLVSFGYVFSSFDPVSEHIRNSIDRLMTQVVPLVWLWIAAVASGLPPSPKIGSGDRGEG
jgi:hypothetical protein